MKTVVLFIPRIFGFLVMAGLGWLLASPISKELKTQASQVSNIPRSHERPNKLSRDESIVAEQMGAIREAGSSIERSRRTIALATSLAPSEFAAWVEGDRFNSRKGPELIIFRMIIFERWIKEDPDSLIPWAVKNNYGQAGRALQFLAENEPQSIIGHFHRNSDPVAELKTLADVARRHPALALERMKEISSSYEYAEARNAASNLLIELAKNSPAALKASLVDFPSNLQKDVELIFCAKRLESSYATEIKALWGRPDGWDVFCEVARRNSELETKLLNDISDLPQSWKDGIAERAHIMIDMKNGKEWFNTDLEAAGFSSSQAQKIRDSALRQMIYSDPEFALENLTTSNISLVERRDLISNAIRANSGDAQTAEKLIKLLTTEEDKRLAREHLVQIQVAVGGRNAKTPTEWLGKIGDLNDASSNEAYEALSQIQEWDKSKIAELRSSFDGLSLNQKQNIARLVSEAGVGSQVDPGFVGDVIRSLVANPPAIITDSQSDPVNASSTYAVKMALNDPEAAVAWIDSLPAGDTKLWAYKNLATNWKQYDPKAVSRWIKTLPTDAKAQVTEHLKKER